MCIQYQIWVFRHIDKTISILQILAGSSTVDVTNDQRIDQFALQGQGLNRLIWERIFGHSVLFEGLLFAWLLCLLEEKSYFNYSKLTAPKKKEEFLSDVASKSQSELDSFRS